MKLIIPGELPDLNTIIDAAKRGKGRWQPYNELKRESTEAVAWPAKRLPKASRVYLVITWYCKDKHKDPDNIAAAVKFIWDGLVAAGVIPNDGWKENAGWENHFEVDKQNPRVEIDLMYLGGDSHGKATPMKVEPFYRQRPGGGEEHEAEKSDI